MKKAHIFLVSGKARSGKDEFCSVGFSMLPFNLYGYKFAFADAVKEVARTMGWDGKKDERGRSFLQFIGDGARGYDDDVWIKQIFQRINETFDRIECFFGNNEDEKNVVIFISDCRYPNEIDKVKQWVKENFSDEVRVSSIRVVRPLDFDNGLTFEQKQNSSETALDDYVGYDYIIANTGTLQEYRNKCRDVIKTELGL